MALDYEVEILEYPVIDNEGEVEIKLQFVKVFKDGSREVHREGEFYDYMADWMKKTPLSEVCKGED